MLENIPSGIANTDGSIVDLDQIFYEVKGRNYPIDPRGK